MTDQPGSPDRPQRVRAVVRPSGALRGAAVGVAGIGVAILIAVLVFRELGPAGVKPTATPSPSYSTTSEPSPSPSPEPSATETVEPSPSSTSAPSPSPLPSVVIAGDLPGPEATVPPGYRLVPNVSVESLAATAESAGMSCGSELVNYPHVGAYNLGCEGHDAVAHAAYSFSAVYWTLDGFSFLDLSVVSDANDTEITDPSLPPRIILPIAALVGGEAAREWAAARLDDPSCHGDGCERSFDGFNLIVQVGAGWGRGLIVNASGP